MKKAAVLGAFAVLSLTLIASSPAIGQSNDESTVSEFCAAHNDLGLTHGGCVAFFVTRNLTPHDASVCRNESMQAFLGVTNHGLCVKKLKEMAK